MSQVILRLSLLALAVASVGAIGGAEGLQSQVSPIAVSCGDTADMEVELEMIQLRFTGDAPYTEYRVRNNLPTLDLSITATPVADSATCNILRQKVDSLLGSNAFWTLRPRKYAYMKMGPYLAVLVAEDLDAQGLIGHSRWVLEIFKEEDYAHIPTVFQIGG
ncbi:MAG TPA: hypothetical protein VGR37_16255 [Longimicrobiaceae bacterium]|nr:hypothetical protein [Longimicrobiaceae bacterium]